MTAAFKGNSFLLKLPTTASGTDYATVAACRSNSLTLNKSAIDITNKGSGGWTEALAGGGVKNATISASGVYTDEASQARLVTAFMASTHWKAQIIDEGGNTFSGAWNFDSLSFSGDSDVEQTFEVTLSSSGELTFAAA